ncbi:ABC transporter ATP-binding protein [Leucobacter allii]|uniref:metal ABC transporter ATP-binding protein n=1 Tax=Leucobacter allii TaxID=2932247 RepID=UPI001FD26DC0|nr:ABC transporter ATP-binding protein [Leucobacter allii]UOR01408.1 ABC transporter ATP-binding protein [Leucobacter allii]
MTAALELHDAAFGYDGVSRVEGLSLEVPSGAAVALIGPNGSGKSTLLRGILGLAERTAGTVRVLGEAPERARRRIGSLPQADTRDATLPITLRQAVTMGLYRSRGALAPIGRSGRAAVAAALERVGLAELAARRFGELSGGQQQRGILARALVSDPQLLLLDEPFNGLDRENREVLLRLVGELRAEGRTIVVSTHDLEIAQEACSHVLLLASGHRPGQPGHPAAFGPLDAALTLDAVQHAFQGTTVELDHHTVTTTRETE